MDIKTLEQNKEDEKQRLRALCDHWVKISERPIPPPNYRRILGLLVRVNRLINEVFKEFEDSIDHHKVGDESKKVSLDDLIRYWKRITLEISRVDIRFAEVEKSLGWVPEPPPKLETKEAAESLSKVKSMDSTDEKASSDKSKKRTLPPKKK